MFFFDLTSFWYNWNIIHGIILLFLNSFFLALFLQISFFSLLVRSLQLLISVGLIFIFIIQLKNIIIIPGFLQNFGIFSILNLNDFFLNNFGSVFNKNIKFFESLVSIKQSTTLWFLIDYDPLYNLLIMVLLLFLIFLFIGLSDYMMLKENYRVEYPLLFYLIFISGICLFLSNDLISILLSLECITFLGYILVGFDKVKRLSASSGIRYLILGSIPSAFLVIGLSFIYYNFGIFAKDALEIISFSLIENSNWYYDKFTNIENSLKYNLNNNSYITLDINKSLNLNFLFYIDFIWLDISYILKNFLLICNNNINFLNIETIYPYSNSLIENSSDFSYAKVESNMMSYLFKTDYSKNLYYEVLEDNNNVLFKDFNKSNNVMGIEPYELVKNNLLFHKINDLNLIGLEYIQNNDILNINVFLENIIKSNFIFLDNNAILKALLLFQISAVFIIINLLFKVTASPFHVWAPSIYTNAPTMSVIFLSIFIKLIIFSFFILVIAPMFYSIKNVWGFILLIIGVLSIFSGLIGAFNEIYLKRFIIYSSVGHVGFIILGLPFILVDGYQYMLNYLYIYSITSIILWLIVSLNINEIKFLTNLKTILMRNFVLSIIFTFVIFSMSGIPPLAGFFVKFDILLNLMKSTNMYIVALILLLTVISFFYYLRMIKIIFFETVFWNVINKSIKWSNYRFLIISFLINIVLLYSIIMEQGFSYYFYEIILFIL